MGTTSSITMQSLGKIAQCAPAIGAKIWCLFFYRQDAAKRQTAGIKFTQAKNQVFRPDSLHRFTSNLAGPTATWVRMAVQNFTSIATGVGMRPQKISKISTILVKSRPTGATPLIDF